MRSVQRKRAESLPAPAFVIYDPVSTDIHDDRLRALFDRYKAERAQGRVPIAHEILHYPEMAALRRNVMLLEIVPRPLKGHDFVYRVYGVDIAQHYGRDMTGHSIGEFPSGVAGFFTDLYETAIARRLIIHSLHTPPLDVNVRKWERLILPLGDPVRWLLVVNIPKGRRKE